MKRKKHKLKKEIEYTRYTELFEPEMFHAIEMIYKKSFRNNWSIANVYLPREEDGRVIIRWQRNFSPSFLENK